MTLVQWATHHTNVLCEIGKSLVEFKVLRTQVEQVACIVLIKQVLLQRGLQSPAQRQRLEDEGSSEQVVRSGQIGQKAPGAALSSVLAS